METTILCQTCLGQLELPINLFESSYSDLLDVLQRLLSFQVYDEEKQFNVCCDCHRRLNWITQFQNMCLKALEPLRKVKYIKTEQAGVNNDLAWNVDMLELSPRFEDILASTTRRETAKTPKQEIVGKETNLRKRRRVRKTSSYAEPLDKIEVDSQEDDNDDDNNGRCCSPFADNSDVDNDYEAKKSNKKLSKKLQRDETTTKSTKRRNIGAAVLQAIKQFDRRQTALKNRQCVFCKYLSTTFAMLKSHVIKKHKDIINTWCENCNIPTDELKDHRSTTRCHLWLCRFCDRGQQTPKRLREHLKICPKGRNAAVTEEPDEPDEPDVSKIPDVIPDDTDVNKLKPTRRYKMFNRKKIRLKRFPRHVVLQAIKEVNSYRFDMKNRQCLFCDFVGEKAVALQTHMKHKHRGVTMENNWCRHCNVLVDDVQTHRDSVRCHIWQCKLCKNWGGARRASTLFSHLRVHGGIRSAKQYSQEEVSQTTPKGSKGKRDKQVNSHLCALCGKVFKTYKKLQDHSCGSAEKLFKCPICARSYRSEKSLRTHKKEHGSFMCQICGKRSTSKSCHRIHMQIHEAGGPVQCTICNKVFVRPGRLKLHMKEHTGNHQCMVCGKSFRVKWLLVNHMRVHNEERPYKCSYCGRGFNAKATCVRHELTHTGEKPFKCLICPYSAVNIFHLTTHMKQHPEDAPQASKPFKCPLCHRSFSTNTVLVSHTRLVHGNRGNE